MRTKLRLTDRYQLNRHAQIRNAPIKLMRILSNLLVAVTPLFLTFLFAWLMLERQSFSSEKDIVLVVPLLVWSLAFLLTYVFIWWRKRIFGRSLSIAAAVATGFFLGTSILLFGIPRLWFH